MTVWAGRRLDADDFTLLENTVRAGCTLRRAANQSIASAGSGAAISWDTADENTPVSFIIVTGSTITIPAGYGGLYGIAYRAAGAWTTRVFCSINITSALTGYPATTREDTNPSDLEISRGFGPVPLLAGDSFNITQFHQTGVNVNVTAWMACYRIGP